MQIFEYQFNPDKKNYKIEVFYCESKNQNKNLYIVGEIKNSVPENQKIISLIIKKIKDEYYSNEYDSSELALKKALIKANDYLSEEKNKNNIEWLGNLNLAVISLSGSKIDIAKTGKIRTVLIQYEKVKELKDETVSATNEKSFKVKAFGRIVSGKLINGDRICIITEDVYDVLTKNKITEKISELPFLDKELVDEIIDSANKSISNKSGLLFLIDRKGKCKKKTNIFKFPEKETDFSIKEAFLPIRNLLSKIKPIKKSKIKDELKSSPLIVESKKTEKKWETKKIAVLIGSLLVLLFLGYLIFNDSGSSISNKKIEELIYITEERINEINELDSVEDKDLIYLSLVELYYEIDSIENDRLIEIKKYLTERIEESINTKKIDNPVLVFSPEQKDFNYKKVFFFKNKLYLYENEGRDLTEYCLKEKESIVYTVPSQINFVDSTNNRLFVFSKPNKVYELKENQIVLVSSLNLPSTDSVFTLFSSYANNFYFWDSALNNIYRYSLSDLEPKKWIDENNTRSTDIKSMSVDGSILLIENNLELSKYYLGKKESSVALNFFPKESFYSQVKFNSSINLSIALDSLNNRLIVFDKENNLVNQIKIENLNLLKSFDFSDDGNYLFILNNNDVYQITI